MMNGDNAKFRTDVKWRPTGVGMDHRRNCWWLQPVARHRWRQGRGPALALRGVPGGESQAGSGGGMTTALTEKLLDYLSRPRSMAQIREHLGDDKKARFAVYNAVARGQVRNLNAGQGRKAGGLFVRTHDALPTRAGDVAPTPGRGRPPAQLSLDWRTGLHLQQVWRGQGGMAA